MLESFVELILSLLISVIAMFIYRVRGRYHTFYSLMMIVLFCIECLLCMFWVGCYYFTGEGINDSVIFTLTRSLTGVGISEYLIPLAVTLVVFISLVLVIFKWILHCPNHTTGRWFYSVFSIVLAVMAIVISPTFVQLQTYNKPPEKVDGSDFDKYVVIPEGKLTQAKYNLVYIYGESLERTYFDESTFPNLMPELTSIKEMGLDFTNTEQFPATDFTIAGIIASQCGFPLLAPTDLSGKTASNGFFSNSICLGDILKNTGYETWFIQGADLRFADKNIFFKTHGIDNVWGLQESEYVKDSSKQNEWGLYDDIVLEKVWDKFETLSKNNKPFAIFTLTLDTHPPHGYISPECNTPVYVKDGGEVPALTAVRCSQSQITRLIHRIQSSPWSKNTVIVLSSDHLVMPNMTVAVDYLNKMTRRDLFVILKDGVAPRKKDERRSTLDNGATVLEALGGGNALGLGRSSLSQPSLATIFPDFKNKLLAWGPGIRSRWGVPDKIDEFKIDLVKKKIAFDNYEYNLPIILEITRDKVWPVVDDGLVYGFSLRRTLGFLPVGEHYIWVDQCLKMASLGGDAQINMPGWCIAQGYTGNKPFIDRISAGEYSGKASYNKSAIDSKLYKKTQDNLLKPEDEIKYDSAKFIFAADGTPKQIKSIAGLSHTESWGRWSDAVLADKVAITYEKPLPKSFDVELKAKAYGKNIGQEINVSVGDCSKNMKLGEKLSTVKIHFDNVNNADTLIITPPFPEITNDDNFLGFHQSAPPRKLGVGFAELRIIPPE